MTLEIDSLLIDESALHKLMQEHIDWVSRCLADGTRQSWPPHLAALVKAAPDDAKGELFMHALALDFNEHDEKHAAMRMIGRSIYEAQKVPVAVVLSSECWLSRRRGGVLHGGHCEPRHDPARQEGIQISGLALGRKHAAMTFALIERDAKENMKIDSFTPLVKPERLPLLESFFLGFFEEIAAKNGIKLPEVG